MPIQDSDLFLIEDTSGASKKIAASKLKANLAANTYNNYKLLVNKPDYSSRFVYAQNMQASVGLTDYMLIERTGVSYKVTGQQIIDYFPSVPAGAAGPITDVENTTSPTYDEAVTEPHSNGATTTAVLFNGEFSARVGTKNIGSSDIANRTTVVPFNPPLKNVAKLVAFAPNSPTGITVNHEDGTSQSSFNGFNGLNLVDFPINSSSPITEILLPGNNTNSTWIVGFKDSNDQPILNGVNESTLTLASDTNLELFTVGDKINMVDSDGNVVYYGPQTSAVTSVTETDYTNTIVATSYTFQSDQDFSVGSLSNVFNREYDSRGFTSNGYGIAPNLSHPSANPYRWHLYTFPSPITVQESFMMDIYDGNYVEGQASLGFIDSEGNETLTNLAVEDRIITNFSGYRYAIPGLAPGTVITAVKYRIDPLGPKSSKRCIDLVYALIHDGLVLTDGIKKLNFASPNPDLSLFKEGTIVNGINTPINTSYNWSTGWRINNTGIGNLTNSFDGDVNTWGMLMDSTNVGAGKPITGYWDVKESPYINNRRSQIYVRPGAEIEFKIKTNGLTGEIKIFEITGEYESSTNLLATYDAKPARTETIIYTQPEGYWLQGISGNRGSNTSGRATIELAYMKIDGVMLVDGTDRATAEVQTVDLADNCMYVNNGDFSPPNTVSAEGVSGTGNFNGYSGNIVDVINSNQEWVADPNHFIKPASTRTGLAILRTKAVAAATEIAQSVSEIPEGSFAIVKNNYWFRDEDNLIDLGPTNLPTK